MCERGAPAQLRAGASSADLAEAVERYASRPRAQARTAQEVQGELVALRRLVDRLELESASLVAELAGCGEEAWQGHPSPSAWMSHECRTTTSAAWNALVVGTRTAHLPQSTAALRQGEIGFAHLAVIARTADWVCDSPGSPSFDEQFLLRRARNRSVAELRRDAAHVRHALDPRRYLREQVEQVEARFLELRLTEGGGLWLRGFLDGEGGATLGSALEPLSRPEGPADRRNRERRHADALVELCARALDSGSLPRHSGERPHLQVTVSLDTLLGRGGSGAGELQGGGPIAAETARRLGCDASVSRVIFGPGSVLVDAGRARRVIPPSTRRALVARDAGCVWPGCGRPAAWCQGHHLRHWARGGTTDLANMILLCRPHHFKVHEAGWQIIRAGAAFRAVAPLPDGLVPQARPPDRQPAA
jgi:hypothetical protein